MLHGNLDVPGRRIQDVVTESLSMQFVIAPVRVPKALSRFPRAAFAIWSNP
jgi:hypothetical protein